MAFLSIRALEFVSLLVIFSRFSSESALASYCFNALGTVNSIPESHLYHKKDKPLVIGHHGNPSEFQENTLDGFKSLTALKADGMELDTFLTKDGQLVVIHYDNTEKLTGKNHSIWDITYEELKELHISSKLTYGKKEYDFGKTRAIPLLSEVFDAVKDDKLLMYLNMKPGYVRNLDESKRIGQAVARLISEKRVGNNVLLSSFDPFKVRAAKQANSSLVVGMFYKTGMWTQGFADKMKSSFADLPEMRGCVEEAPNGTDFMNFLFQTGHLLRATNSSYVVMDYNIFNNPEYSKNTFETFANNYSSTLSFGAFIIDNLALSDEDRKRDEAKLDLLIQNKASALVTDDIPRLRKKLGRSEPPKASRTHTNFPAVAVMSTVIFLGWFWRC